MNNIPHKKWWVFFVPAQSHFKWYYHLLPSYRGVFQHTYAACEVSDNVILIVDPANNGMVHSLILGRPADHIRETVSNGGRVLFVEFETPREDLLTAEKMNRRGWLMTCASVIGYCLGLDSRAITPKGLWRVLIRDYAAREVDYGKQAEGQFRPGRVAAQGVGAGA